MRYFLFGRTLNVERFKDLTSLCVRTTKQLLIAIHIKHFEPKTNLDTFYKAYTI